MAIKNELNFKGLIAPEAYSRIAAINIDSRGVEPKVNLTFQDFASAEAAEKVLEDVKRLATQSDFDADPALKAEADAQKAAEQAKYEAADNLDAWTEAEKTWAPTVYVTEKKWLGKRAADPLQERAVELPLEAALAVITATVPGDTPDGTADNLTAQAYRAAMGTGQFTKAKAV